MFPEYRELISRLKTTDHHFARLFDKHNALDHEIWARENGQQPSTQVEIERLKKEKLAIKDQLYAILKRVEANGA
jgi:uncharacterized protein YdcH (DUF465 family)